jgi:hypothetical protein
MDAGVSGVHQSFVSAVQQKYCQSDEEKDEKDPSTSDNGLINKHVLIFCPKMLQQNAGRV